MPSMMTKPCVGGVTGGPITPEAQSCRGWLDHRLERRNMLVFGLKVSRLRTTRVMSARRARTAAERSRFVYAGDRRIRLGKWSRACAEHPASVGVEARVPGASAR